MGVSFSASTFERIRRSLSKVKGGMLFGHPNFTWNQVCANTPLPQLCLTLHLVMAMRVSRAHDFALTVSADHIIGRYDLTVRFPCCFPRFHRFKSFPSCRLTNLQLSSLVLLTARRTPALDQLQSETMEKCVQLEGGMEGK